MLTPLEDIDIIYLLPYLSLYDIAQVIRIRKHLPLEYKSKLDSFKWKTLCDLSFHTQLPCNSIRFIAGIDGSNDAGWKDNLKTVEDIRLKRDLNGVPYIRVVYPDKLHTHIIYHRKIKLKDGLILLYTK